METGRIIKIGGAIIIVMLIFSLGAPVSPLADTIKIGMIDPFSGPFEYYGRMYHAGLKYAVDEVNKKGGLLDKKIEILKENHEFKPDTATRKAKKLILEDKVDFLGVSGTHTSVAVHKVAKRYKKIVFNYGGGGDIITGKEFNKYFFRVCPTSYQIVSTMVNMAKQTKDRRFYLLNMDYSYGHGAAKAFEEQLKIIVPDAEVVGVDFHPIGTKDFAPYINKVIAAKADAIFSANVGPDATNLVKQARDMGLKAPFPVYFLYGPDAYMINSLKDDSVGLYFGYTADLASDTPEGKAFVKKYHEYHKSDEDYLTWWPINAISFVALGMKMALAAVERAGSLEPEKIIETFEGFWYKSPYGWYSMRKCDHQITLPIFAGVVSAGKNPWFNGNIDPAVNFPWVLKSQKFSAMSIAIPPTSDYNPRCP